jgi:hypothetical protein
MGKHYVPRQHLRRFQIQDKPEIVWLYDKNSGRFAEAAISKVAQQPNFYSPDVESALAEVVELPGNIAIDKLLRREKISNRERTQLSLYLMTMLTRGPRQRRKSLERAPEILKGVVADVQDKIEEWIDAGADPTLAAARIKELREVEERFSKEIPSQILELIRTPFWSERTVECIHNMRWHVLPAPTGTFFVTSDTPVHLFDCYGVGTPESELAFAMSKDFALIGEHQSPWGTVFEKPQAQLAKEVNRRILSHAERFVFSAKKAVWIETVAKKEEPHLSRILWH